MEDNTDLENQIEQLDREILAAEKELAEKRAKNDRIAKKMRQMMKVVEDKRQKIAEFNRVTETQRFTTMVELADTLKMIDEMDETADAMKNAMKAPKQEQASGRILVEQTKDAIIVFSERMKNGTAIGPSNEELQAKVADLKKKIAESQAEIEALEKQKLVSQDRFAKDKAGYLERATRLREKLQRKKMEKMEAELSAMQNGAMRAGPSA